MDEDLNRVISVFKSIVSLNDLKVERFDIQRILRHGASSYVGYLTIYGEEKTLLIRPSGIFEFVRCYGDNKLHDDPCIWEVDNE